MDAKTLERQLNELPPEYIVEMAAQIYGKTAWDVAWIKVNVPSGIDPPAFVFCSCRHVADPSDLTFEDLVNPERRIYSELRVYRIRNHMGKRLDLWIGKCHNCSLIYWDVKNE